MLTAIMNLLKPAKPAKPELVLHGPSWHEANNEFVLRMKARIAANKKFRISCNKYDYELKGNFNHMVERYALGFNPRDSLLLNRVRDCNGIYREIATKREISKQW